MPVRLDLTTNGREALLRREISHRKSSPMSTTIQCLARAGTILALAAMLAAIGAPVQALAGDERHAACTSDVFRLCNNEVPRVDNMISCLKKKSRAIVNPGCRASVNGKK
jgi:hypothetical protein